nr:carbohydrate sulfotransferase 10 isoform X2 [Pseudochaenichthys georgianus]
MEELDNPTNMRVIVSKLPYKFIERWKVLAFKIQERSQRRVRFKDLVDFVDEQAKILADPLFGDLQGSAAEAKSRNVLQMEKTTWSERIKGSILATSVATSTEEENCKPLTVNSRTSSNVAFMKPCLFCKKDRALLECHQIAEKPHKDKVDFIWKSGLCFGCLVKGHVSKDCKKRMTCQTCSERHPSLLHIHKKDNVSNYACAESQKVARSDNTAVSSALVSLNQETTTCEGAGDRYVLAILPVYIKAKKGSKLVKTYAFVDPGSSATFCTDSLARQLNLQGKGAQLVLTTMSSTKQVKSSLLRDLEVCGIKEDKFISLKKVSTQKSIPVTKDYIPLQKDIEKWPSGSRAAVRRC